MKHFFALTLAGYLWCGLALHGSAQDSASTSRPALGTQLENSDRQEKSELDRRLVDLTSDLATFTAGLFYATLALFGATVALAIFAWKQSGDMRKSLTIASDAAEAAKTSAATAQSSIAQAKEHFQIERRAYIGHMPNGAHFELVRATAGMLPIGPVKYFEMNHGLTPALKVKMYICIWPGIGAPPDFDGPFTRMEVMKTILPGQNIGKIVGTQTPNDAFFLYGFVKYFDIFGRRWKRRFAFSHDPNRPNSGQDRWIAHLDHNDELAWDFDQKKWLKS